MSAPSSGHIHVDMEGVARTINSWLHDVKAGYLSADQVAERMALCLNGLSREDALDIVNSAAEAYAEGEALRFVEKEG